MGRSNSRSHSSRSKSRSRSTSRSRSRSHSRKKRYSSRSRSRTYSRSRSRERMYNRDSRDSRDSRDNRDNRDNRDYHRDFRNNRGMRRPYGFRPMRRGFFPGGGPGRFHHRGGFRPMWNRRHSRSPRRGRSRSRTPKRRSVSSQRSRSRSHRSYRSSRSPMSSSSRSSSQYSKSPPVRPKKRASREKKPKKPRPAALHDSPLNSKSHDKTKDAFERDPSESLDEFSKASGVGGDTWAGLSAYDNSPRSPHSPSPVASPSSLSSSDSDTPILSTAKDTTSPRSQHSAESIDNGSARYSPSQNSPLHHVPSRRSPTKTVPLEEHRTGEVEPTKGGKIGKRPLHKMESREKSSFRDESPLRIKMVASESHRPEVKLKMNAVPLDDADRSTFLMSDRLLASTLVHSVNKDQEFRSIFDHVKLPQSSKTSSESFVQHIVSLVHYVQEHYFKSAGMTLHDRFGEYQKASEEQAAQQKSPEIHRRLDISPSTLRKHTSLAGEEKVFKVAPKTDKKLRGNSTDKRHDVERRRKHRSKERGNSKGSRESSGSRKQEKLKKEYKEFKLYKDESKRKNKEKEPSQSPSSSSSSREDKDVKKEREEDFRSQQEQKEFSVFSGVSRPRGTFFRIRGRGRARGVFPGPNPGPTNLNPPPFPKRPPEEEWDPEYTPKSKKYFLHDDRDDGVDYWANRGRGRGTFQRGRGRFTFKKSGSSPKWTHDKYQGDGLVEDEDEAMENNEERKDRRKEEKD